MFRIALMLTATLAFSCEKPPPKEPSPEHAECLAAFDEYATCKTAEAGQLGDAAGKPIKRALEAQERLAKGSLANCEKQLAKIADDDPCAP